MTVQPKSVIKTYFQTGDLPTQAQYEDLIDSYADVSASIPTSAAGAVGLQVLSCITTASVSNIVAGGLGTMATQNANNVSITGGNIGSVNVSAATIVNSTVSGGSVNGVVVSGSNINGASNTITNVPVSSFSGIIGITAGGTGVPAQPKFYAYRNAVQAIADNSASRFNLNVEVFDTNSNFDTSTSRFTPTIAGYYSFTAAIAFAAGVADRYFYSAVHKNGTIASTSPSRFTGTGTQAALTTCILPMNGTTDFVEMYVYQNTGAPQNATSDFAQSYMCGAYLGN